MTISQLRAAAVAETVARVREIERREGVTRVALDRIKAELIALGRRAGLFPFAHFPVPAGKHGEIYRLSEDADRRFALYASVGRPGKAQPPHNHTTWAAIAGVHGEEHNVFYTRVDDRSVPGHGTLRQTGALTVRQGDACAFLPDDFHTIDVTGDAPSLHLHMYGLSLEELPGRIAFAHSEGGAFAVFPASPTIRAPLVDVHALKAMLRGGDELALFDVREEGEFADGHLFWATSLPLSRLELRVASLAPRRGARVVIMDGGDGASRARLPAGSRMPDTATSPSSMAVSPPGAPPATRSSPGSTCRARRSASSSSIATRRRASKPSRSHACARPASRW